jgi:signal transduction histidine kinase
VQQAAPPAARLLEWLPRGNTLDDRAWARRHRLLRITLALHLPGIALLGFALGNPPAVVGSVLVGPLLGLVLGWVLTSRRPASFAITGGLVFCSAALVVITTGSIEAHFHFFIIIGFIALYQDWVPFLWNVGFTVISHSIGTIWLGNVIFAHPAGQADPWLWSSIHGLAVLAACVGMVIFWRITEDEQTQKEALGRKLVTADAEIGRRRFASDLLVNLARRNQSMLYRQLDIINQLEDSEQDPDVLAELFTLDHLATRVRRNAESLLVLAGEQPPRVWSAPVLLRDVVRAAVAETEDLDRVEQQVPEVAGAVFGHLVADLTHLLAELTENAVRFSPPDTSVTVRARRDPREDAAWLVTVEDWGVGMPPDDLAAANELLSDPRDVDVAATQRLGFHVVSRLAARHGIRVSLTATPGSGITAVAALPAALFAPLGVGGRADARGVVTPPAGIPAPAPAPRPAPAAVPGIPATEWIAPFAPAPDAVPDGGWRGWWDPELHGAPPAPGGPLPATASFVPSPRPRAAPVPAGQVPAAQAHPAPAHAAQAPAPQGAANGAGARAAAVAPPAAAAGTSPGGLRRRVPQSHLAPELRAPGDALPDTPPDPAAGSALSRYQASRAAAQRIEDQR